MSSVNNAFETTNDDIIDNNSEKIDKQLENLKGLSDKIQNVVLENEKLQEDKTDLREILNGSPKNQSALL